MGIGLCLWEWGFVRGHEALLLFIRRRPGSVPAMSEFIVVVVVTRVVCGGSHSFVRA